MGKKFNDTAAKPDFKKTDINSWLNNAIEAIERAPKAATLGLKA